MTSRDSRRATRCRSQTGIFRRTRIGPQFAFSMGVHVPFNSTFGLKFGLSVTIYSPPRLIQALL